MDENNNFDLGVDIEALVKLYANKMMLETLTKAAGVDEKTADMLKKLIEPFTERGIDFLTAMDILQDLIENTKDLNLGGNDGEHI